MYQAINLVIFIIALLHLYFLILEMFLWDKPIGLKIFRMSKEKAETTKILAANQGLYNGFLAAGIFWGLYQNDIHFKFFFLICISLAGLYGAVTASKTILYVQALPALIALALLYFLSYV